MLKEGKNTMRHYAVIDLEMCKVQKNNRNVFRKSTETIQIGAVLLNENFEITDSFMTFVEPEFGVIDSYIQDLTGISRMDTHGAPSFEEAVNLFLDWIPEDTTLVTWSENDEIQLKKETELKGLSIPGLSELLDSYFDCQELFSQKMDSCRRYRLSEAINLSDIDFREGAHDALVDAYNTSLLFAKLRREPEFELNKYFLFEDELEDFSTNPFADLFTTYAIAV